MIRMILATVILVVISCDNDEKGFETKIDRVQAAPPAAIPFEDPVFQDADAIPIPVTPPDVRIKQTTFSRNYPVDIIMAVDTSGSMGNEKTQLEMNMAGFFTALEDKKIDAHVTVIGGGEGGLEFQFPADLEPTEFQVVDQYVNSINTISHLTTFFKALPADQGGYGPLPLPLREGAPVEIVAISDDNGRGVGNTAGDFVGPENKNIFFNSIVGTADSDTTDPACNIPNIGLEYITLSNDSGGSVFDLCTKNWDELVETLSQNISKRNTGYPIVITLNEESDLAVFVDDQLIAPEMYEIVPLDPEDENSLSGVKFVNDFDLDPGKSLAFAYTVGHELADELKTASEIEEAAIDPDNEDDCFLPAPLIGGVCLDFQSILPE